MRHVNALFCTWDASAGATPLPHARYGFTAVELLAVTALSALLMLTVVKVIGALARDRHVMDVAERRAPSSLPPFAALAELVRQDLAHASRLEYRANSILLTGHGFLEGASREPTHRPSVVRYLLWKVGERTWLVRQQGTPELPSRRDAGLDLLWPDVTGFELRPIQDATGPTNPVTSTAPKVHAAHASGGHKAGAHDNPGLLRLSVRFHDTTQADWEQEFLTP